MSGIQKMLQGLASQHKAAWDKMGAVRDSRKAQLEGEVAHAASELRVRGGPRWGGATTATQLRGAGRGGGGKRRTAAATQLRGRVGGGGKGRTTAATQLRGD